MTCATWPSVERHAARRAASSRSRGGLAGHVASASRSRASSCSPPRAAVGVRDAGLEQREALQVIERSARRRAASASVGDDAVGERRRRSRRTTRLARREAPERQPARRPARRDRAGAGASAAAPRGAARRAPSTGAARRPARSAIAPAPSRFGGGAPSRTAGRRAGAPRRPPARRPPASPSRYGVNSRSDVLTTRHVGPHVHLRRGQPVVEQRGGRARCATSPCRSARRASSAISAYENSSTSRNQTACRNASGSASRAAWRSASSVSRKQQLLGRLGGSPGRPPPARSISSGLDRHRLLDAPGRRAVQERVVEDREQPGLADSCPARTGSAARNAFR